VRKPTDKQNLIFDWIRDGRMLIRPLPLNGKKRKLSRADWLDCLARERLGLADAVVNRILADLYAARQTWQGTIADSFLSIGYQAIYREIVAARLNLLFG
jgi:hypothetical protein